MRACPGVVCTEISRPLASKPSPLDPLVLSRNTDVAPVSLSMRVMRLAWVSVKIRLPSGRPTGPSVPVNPDLITSTFVPPATTPGISVATVSAATGGVAGCARAAAVASAAIATASPSSRIQRRVMCLSLRRHTVL